MSLIKDSLEIATKMCIDSYCTHIESTLPDVSSYINVDDDHALVRCLRLLMKLARSARTHEELCEGFVIANSIQRWCCASWESTGITIPVRSDGVASRISSPINVCSDFARAMLPPTHFTEFLCKSICAESREATIAHRAMRECLVFAWTWVVATVNAHTQRDHETREVVDEGILEVGLPALETCAHFSHESSETITTLLVDRLITDVDYDQHTLAHFIQGVEQDRMRHEIDHTSS